MSSPKAEHLEARLFAAIIESAVDGIVVIDAKGRIETFNPAAESLFGYRKSEVVGRNVSMLMPPPYRDEHDGYLAKYAETGEAKVIGIGREAAGRKADGSTFPLHLSVGEMSVGGDRKFIGILRDLTERVQMEERLREQAALAKLGEMAAVIAHEVKNPLAGIRGAVQVIGSRLPQESREAAVVKEIVSRIDALSSLVQELLLFARPPTPKPVPLEVRSLVTTSVHLLTSDPAQRGVRVEIDGVSPPIFGDAEMLKIVFLNLLINGAQAMAGQGCLRVSIQSSNGTCRIDFIDAGPGMSPDIRGKIFTPFFTTKARGSGLGLPTSKRFIEAHEGTLEIDSPVSGGTRATVRLPLASNLSHKRGGTTLESTSPLNA